MVNAAPEVKAEALPFLRIAFLFSSGMLVFYMLGGALRSAGDARTPMILGIVMTVLNLLLNVVLIRGLGPIPAFGTAPSRSRTRVGCRERETPRARSTSRSSRRSSCLSASAS